LKFDIQFSASLKKIEGISVQAPFFRSLDYKYIQDPLSSLGALKHGGRYNQKGSFEVLYLAPDPETAAKEALKSFSGYLPPRILLTVNVHLQKVLDIQSDEVIKELGIKTERLSGSWQLSEKETYTQKLGRLVYESKYFEGIRYPSAQVAGKYNLAIFDRRLIPGSIIEIYDPNQNLKAKLSG
jgi:RES domain-containing protein